MILYPDKVTMENGRDVTSPEERLGGGIRHYTKKTLSSPSLLKIKVVLG